MINRRVPKKIDTEQFHHFGAVFVKADRETGKVVQKRVCLRDKVAACSMTAAASAATLSRAIKSRSSTTESHL